MGAGGQGGLQHDVGPSPARMGGGQRLQPLQHAAAGGQVTLGAGAREVARHLVRIDEDEGLGPPLQEAVDEGGLPGAVGAGEEDEGGHGGRVRR